MTSLAPWHLQSHRRRLLNCYLVALLLGSWGGGCCNGGEVRPGDDGGRGGGSSSSSLWVSEDEEGHVEDRATKATDGGGLVPSAGACSTEVDALGVCSDPLQGRGGAAGATATTTTQPQRRVVTIRPMAFRDIRVVNRLGRDMFRGADFCSMGRTWDDFSVVDLYVRGPELCFVAEEEEVPLYATRGDGADEATPAGAASEAPLAASKNKKSTVVVGFLLGRKSSKPETGTFGSIEWVAVEPEHRRRGIATRLVRTFQAELLRVHQASAVLARHAAKTNEPAIRLLERCGLRHKIDYVSLTRPMPEVAYERFNPEIASVEYTYVPSEGRTRGGRNDSKIEAIAIRRIEIDDLESLRDLGDELFRGMPTLYREWDDEEILNQYLADSDYAVVATVNRTEGAYEDDENDEIGQILVGFAMGSISEDTRTLQNYGYFVWLGCSPSYQGMGIATELFNSMIELFASEQVDTIIMDTQKDNGNALQFFRRYGFGGDEDHLYLSNVPLKSV